MISPRFKKIFLGICIFLPFFLYSLYYYGIMVKNAPYKFSEFESMTFKYGLGDDLVNTYDSKSGQYNYLDVNDSLVTTRVKLNDDDLLYIHRKAAELGFWDFPEELEGNPKSKSYLKQSPHYFLRLKYQRKAKEVMFDLQFSRDEKLRDAAKQLMDIVSQRINEAEERQKTRPR